MRLLSLIILIDTTHSILFRDETNYDEIGIDGKICPPNSFLDAALLFSHTSHEQQQQQQQQQVAKNGIAYSSEYDPRNKLSKPSSFPHCELKKWVQQLHHDNHHQKDRSRQCPEGEEYVTTIYPKQQPRQRKNNKNVKIIHIATPTNCIPDTTISSLQSLTQYYSNKSNPQIIIAIYIHSQEAIDAFLYQRVWNVFPEVKEGLLCGLAKMKFVVKKVLDDILLKSSARAEEEASRNQKEQQQQQLKDSIANEIATLTKRDIWRYLILWEFGGTVIDLEVLQSLIATTNSAAAADDNSPLINVARQWFASQWFGSTASNDSNNSNNSNNNNNNNNNSDDGDAIITILENGRERVPLTGIMSASPNHPLLYFCAKWALRSMIQDNYLVWGESPDFVSICIILSFCEFVERTKSVLSVCTRDRRMVLWTLYI